MSKPCYSESIKRDRFCCRPYGRHTNKQSNETDVHNKLEYNLRVGKHDRKHNPIYKLLCLPILFAFEVKNIL